MVITTKITFKQYVKLLYSLIYRKPLLKLLLLVATILMLWIVFYNLDIFNLPKPIIYQYLTLFFIVVLQPIGIYITIRRNFNSSNTLRETLKMEMTSKEIKINGESFYLEILWEKLFKIEEEENWFLFYQNNLSAIIIPKKDLNNDEIFTLRKILEQVKNIPVDLKK